MPAPVMTEKPTTSSLRAAQILTLPIIVLAAIASAGGLFLPGLYRDPARIVPVPQGQDLVTLIAMPALAVAVMAARRGSARGTLAWLGLLGYVWYTYLGASVGYYINRFFLIYVALFSLSLFAGVAVAAGMDAAQIRSRFDGREPRKPVIAFLGLIGLMLAMVELREIGGFLSTGILPEAITRSGGVTFFPYVLDLGLVVPLSLLTAGWLGRRRPWGYVLAGGLLIKAGAMGLALLAMNWFSARAGLPTDGLNALWGGITLGGLGLSTGLLRHCRTPAD